MAHKVVHPAQFPKPRGYSNGMMGVGKALFISGQIGTDQDARIVSPDFATQFLQALDNVIEVVRAAGGATTHIIKLLVFVTNLDAYRTATRAIGEGWRARMDRHYPAMSLVRVAGLMEPGALVEIEGIALLPRNS
ncbi:MAG: RidA family protein [Polyangiaceae bacterium]|nr:RidA family protein [Polyangiaceae bacterium]